MPEDQSHQEVRFDRGDIVRLKDGRIGVVVGFPVPNLNPPITPHVLILREDDRFGSYDGAYPFPEREIAEKLDHIEAGPNMDIRARDWMLARRGGRYVSA